MHREVGARRMDRVLVLRDGAVANFGPLDEIAKAPGADPGAAPMRAVKGGGPE